MNFFPTEEQTLANNRRRRIPLREVKVGDLVEVAGWPAIVTASEPWSDFIWSLEMKGHYADGDPITSSVRIPADVKIHVRRKSRHD